MKTPKLDKQIARILSQGMPNPNDEWSDGKYDVKQVTKYIKRFIEVKMQSAYEASRTLQHIYEDHFDEWLKDHAEDQVDLDKEVFHI